MKYYIVAGEASGDLHGSNLIKAIKLKDPNAQIRAWGGDLMKNAGANIIKDYHELAFMGFAEVIFNLRVILRNLRFCKQDIMSYKPDALILIDYPGFNLRIASFAKTNNFKVIYYISPQIWAWKASRIHKIKKSIDKMMVILPFEKGYYSKFDMDVAFVGHPLLDAIEDFQLKPIKNPSLKPVIALLPGSRKQEIEAILPIMLNVAKKHPQYLFIIAGAPSQRPSFYAKFMKEYQTPIVFNETYSLLKQAEVALVASGTATLEAALMNCPQIVCYKGNSISIWLAKKIVKVKFISLVNLILDQAIVKELIQENLNESMLEKELQYILTPENKQFILNGYSQLTQKLGGKGASQRAAEIVIKATQSK